MTRKQKLQGATVIFVILGAVFTFQESIDAAIAGLICFAVAALLLIFSLRSPNA